MTPQGRLAQLARFAAAGINPGDLFPGPVAKGDVSNDGKRAWEGHAVNGELPHGPTPTTPADIATRAFRRAAARKP